MMFIKKKLTGIIRKFPVDVKKLKHLKSAEEHK